MPKIEDQLLWETFLSGNDQAYAYIYEKYVQDLFIFGRQYSVDRELVKDCIQDVFIKIYKNRAKLTSINNVKLYLFISLKNNILSELKKSPNWTEWIDNIHPDVFMEDTPENLYIAKEDDEIQSEQINKMIEELSPRQQKVIHYRFVECLSIPEIQELMGINYQSVVNLLQRSIIKIRKSFLK